MKSFDLIADIGGTNARFALSDGQKIEHIHVLPCADFPTIEDALRRFFKLSELAIGEIARASIAIANPITGDHIQMTNHHWSFSIRALQESLKFKKLLVINDFTAQALAILRLKDDEIHPVRAGNAVKNAPIAVIGPGTGLGVSGLIPSGKHWIPLTSEGGHVSFAPRDEAELQVWQYAREIYGHVSAERLICGAGLSLIDAALNDVPPHPEKWRSAAEITAGALAGEGRDEQAVAVFSAALATVAADLVLTLGARGGVYLCGGILPRIDEYFIQEGSFNARFTDKGRFDAYLQDVPVWLVTGENPGLQGAAEALKQL